MNSEVTHWFVMNDGARLDASVLTPAGDMPAAGWPAVLLIHGHGEDGSKATTLPQGRRLAGRGYLVICYSVRGQGGSEGLSFHLGARELFDLQDVISEILARWPVDRLGVVGSSQGGWHSWMAAAHHPGVTTAVPQNIFVDYADFAVPDGCLSRWFFTRTMRRRVMTAGLQYLARQWAIEGEWERLREWLRPFSPSLFVERIRCPVLVIHGWHDAGMPAGEILAAFERLRGPRKLYLGGGGHEGRDADEAVKAREVLVDRWLDHWLRDVDTGLMQEPEITYAVRPGWAHRSASSLSADRSQTLYLRFGGTLTADSPDGPTPNANLHNVPTNPRYTLETAIYQDMAGTAEALTLERIAFEGAPLEAPLELPGSPSFRLHLLPNRALIQVHAQLWDVSPSGEAQLISRGHYGTRSATPGRHLEVVITGRDIAWSLPAGHRLRVSFCNYDTDWVFPYYEPWSARLYHEQDRASSITLPLVDLR